MNMEKQCSTDLDQIKMEAQQFDSEKEVKNNVNLSGYKMKSKQSKAKHNGDVNEDDQDMAKKASRSLIDQFENPSLVHSCIKDSNEEVSNNYISIVHYF